MRKYLTLALMFVCCSVCAQNNDSHLKRLIECINDSDYVCADEELQYFDCSNTSNVINVITDIKNPCTLMNFASYIDSLHPHLTDSINKCLKVSYSVLKILASIDALEDREDNALEKRFLSKDISKRVFGEDSKEYAFSLLELGKDYYYRNNYTYSEYFLLQALEILETDIEQSSSDYLESLELLGKISYNQNNYSQYRYYYQKMETPLNRLVNSVHSENDSFSSPRSAYNGEYFYELGHFYFEEGDYKKAEIYLLEALLLMKNAEGLRYLYIETLSSLGFLYKATEDLEKALQYFSLAAELSKLEYGSESSRYFYSLLDLAMILDNVGNHRNAESYLNQVLNFCERDSSYIDLYVGTIQDLGVLRLRKNDKVNAEKIFNQALQVIESKYGVDCAESRGILHNLGILYRDNLSIAEPYLLRAMKIKKTCVGYLHTDFADTEMVLGVLYLENAMYETAEPYINHSTNIYLNNFLQSMGYMTENQRTMYWNKFLVRNIRYSLPVMTYYLSAQQPECSTWAYNYELQIKGILLNSSECVKKSILQSNDKSLIKKWNELTNKKQQIMVLEEKEPQSANLTQLKEEAEQLEKEITKSSSAYRENMRQWEISWDSVRAELKPNQVAIEYMSAPLNDDSTMYCALLLRDTCSYPIMIPLFEEKQMTQDREEQAALIWSNVLPYLNAGDEVYFSPTGIIHQIAIENLPYDSTRTMADVYHMVRLSSTRELAMHRKPTQHSSAALYGDIAYQEMDSTTMVAIASRYNDGTRAATPSRLVDTSQDFEPTPLLPGTKAEIDSIAPILKKQHIAVQVYAQQEACEESVKALSGKKRNILHISTHGFFQPDDGQSTDPMDRCGLYFAGVDKVLEKGSSALPENVDDGILTAKEISLLDLRDADLVVLSACETGLGDIFGEGVFGLQRAFKMAGAQTILMTLWRVNDDTTRMLMTAFYRHYSLTHNKRAAFRAAQQEVRAKYNDPYYWAGFIMLD